MDEITGATLEDKMAKFVKALFAEMYPSPGVWYLPVSKWIFHSALAWFVYTGAVSWELAVLIVVYPTNWRILYATKRARTMYEAQRIAYQQAYNQQQIESGMKLTPEGGEFN